MRPLTTKAEARLSTHRKAREITNFVRGERIAPDEKKTCPFESSSAFITYGW